MYQVRGDVADDISEPPHSGPYPYAPVPHEPDMIDLMNRMRAQGLSPSALPLGVDIDLWLKGGAITFDGFPNTRGGKMDAETIGLAAALQHPNVTLITGARVTRLIAKGDKITAVEYEQDKIGKPMTAPIICLCAGAVKSAALLLARRTAKIRLVWPIDQIRWAATL